MRNRLLPSPAASGSPALVALILSSLLLLRLGAAPALAKGGAEAVAISPDGTRLYIARGVIRSNSITNAVSVVDTTNLTLAATLQPVSAPGVALGQWSNSLLYSMAVSPDGSHLFIGRGGGVDILSPATNRPLGTVKAGPLPVSMAVSPDGQRLYVADTDVNYPTQPNAGTSITTNGGVTVIDSTSGKPLNTLPLHHETRFVLLSPDGHRLYVIGSDAVPSSKTPVPPSSLQILDADTLQVISTVSPGRVIDGAALSPDGMRLYLTTRPVPLTHWVSRLDVYDTGTLQMITSATISSRQYVFGVQPIVSPDGKRIYLTLDNSTDQVRVLDGDTLQVTGALNMGQLMPGGGGLVTLSPDGKTLYVVSPAGDALRVVDTASLQVKATLNLGSVPMP